MKKGNLLFLLITNLITGSIMAQDKPIQLFPKGAPGEQTKLIEKALPEGGKVGGASVLRLSGVSDPTITIYPASDEVATGASMVVCPGGGYEILAYDLEGDEICQWLNEIGVTAVLLKYRVPRRTGLEKHTAPLQDVQRAISLVRSKAEELNLDPQRIGVMGFSAGAHLAAMASTSYDKRTYPEVDAADKVSCKPDFCLLVYPAYLDGPNFTIAPELKVTAHYAICTAFMALGMMLPGMAAGWLQEQLGYENFFIWVMICCIGTLVVTAFLKVDPNFAKKQKE